MSSLASETDRPLDSTSADEFGFLDIAKKLAPSLAGATTSDGMVIGIEGPWGSGKTSLLNFLQMELSKLDRDKLHVITLAPWLTGDTGNLVGELTGAIADILEAQEATSSGWFQKGKKKAVTYVNLFRDYGARTGRRLAPIAKVAGIFYPPAAVIGEGLGQGAEYLQSLGRSPTDAEVKKLISDKLRQFNHQFLVFIDDLDRLEPAQAVEVIRLVRSVADFPQVAYILCYDRSVLAHALQVGLHVENGDLFLQKVVQLTFSIPLPEPFDLRISLRTKALAVFREVMKREPDEDEARDIQHAVDQQGAALRTPREVKLVMNMIKFTFGNLVSDINFADLCRISLIKILNPPLYRWLENYLSVRSVISTGDATVPEDDIEEMGRTLGEILPSAVANSTRSIWSIASFIPGLQHDEKPADRVFQTENGSKIASYVTHKRLGSPRHYRFYFALSGPRTVLSDRAIADLVRLADENPALLAEKLVEHINAPREVGKNWFEHILERFDIQFISQLSVAQMSGWLTAIADVTDFDLANNADPRFFALSAADKARLVTRDLVQTLRERDPVQAQKVLDHIFNEGRALSWIVSELFRTELYSHGRFGDQSRGEDKRFLTSEELDKYNLVLHQRLQQAAETGALGSQPGLSGVLYSWREIAGDDVPKKWVEDYVQDDANLLSFLLEVRGLSVSDKVYRPLKRRSVDLFYDWDTALSRLAKIKHSGDQTRLEQVATIEQAIRDADDRERDD
ncbi:KAP family P-loop NTPase fold protein [Agrobacterium larrymoorei]|uniref:P-loop NTPase fold protein n=1 Tax=Agrobacterium larrymoorei TaxID=160699 RepID=A0AAF0H4S1_9HYPH|nr:P-loop NTPase fold protein [Agrobacterium larrymoorei]WHA39736.1 P-loop NTPase fold protein [Agrobacterium larrymoorei]